MKLGQIPKHTIRTEPVVETAPIELPIEEAIGSETESEENEEAIYGLDSSSPDFHRMKTHLATLKRTNPALYRKIKALD